ncbi:Oidioi.mRNA.OKI2018_I69.XSR.g14457.t1.cds [Oikopleura dioica]|uniref:Oidioi.mRNA.OKI2018_I69.XSR.g14457.t1.cds n=1 Tax=Oikopleura dioica TaxID=34765 RepID=A0ABN7S9U2_OIKDI|nr:Oidioi.mRNA.OKI2018_I69.XSR.g14457.t1.cds [Oikopleura dioica]
MDSERRFLQNLIDAHSNDDTSTGQTKLRRRQLTCYQKRVVAAQYVDEQIKETYLSGLLFRHLYQNFSKFQTKEEISTGEFPHQLVIQIIEHCIQEADIEEKDPEILLKNCLCILPSVSEKISDSVDQQNRPESYRKYFLESWKKG